MAWRGEAQRESERENGEMQQREKKKRNMKTD